MSASGFRGRGFGPRGARTNGPSNGFSGPRFPHPAFNHARPPPHRLPGSEKWADGPNFTPWQQNKNFIPRPQYRNLSFRPNNRGRAISGRGIVRFSGPGRPPGPQFCMGFPRNPVPRVPAPQEEQIVVEKEKPVPVPQTPLLGSEEERQQKITETADKLKEKLSSITEEDLTKFWEDDLSFLPNSNSEEGIALKKGIPELRHGPPELDLTFTDFRDIGRVDCNNSQFGNTDDRGNDDDIIIAFECRDANKITSKNDGISIMNDNQGDSLNISELMHDNDRLNRSSILLEDDGGCQEQMFHELSNPDCNLESLQLQCDNVAEDLQFSNTNTDGNLNLDENIGNVTSIRPIDDLINESSLVFKDIETVPEVILNDQDVLPTDFLENQSATEDAVEDVVAAQGTSLDTNEDDRLKTNANQEENVQAYVPQEDACRTSASTSDSTRSNSAIPLLSNEETPVNSVCDSISPTCLPYDEAQKLCNPPAFQPRSFNVPPRFAPRIPPGPRCRWTFQPNGKNAFFRGPQRLPFHGNRMPPPRHMGPYGPCAPPPFTHNVPVSSHDAQHHTLVPFSSSDLPPAFDPSEPPPNIRSISVTESSNRQEITQSRSPLDPRSQATSVPPSNLDVMQPPLPFDLRGPLPRIGLIKTNEKLPEFNPQHLPPKIHIHKRDDVLQPPPIFDPRLSSQERSKLIPPLNPSGSHMMANFSQPPLFMPSLPVNFQPVLPQTNNGQVMVQDYGLPLPPMNLADVPPPLPHQGTLLEKESSSSQQGVSMDDGLEDMQEAMEFAKQIMDMSEKMKSSRGSTSSVLPEVQCTPSEIPVPKEDLSSPANQSFVNSGKKQKKKKKKKKDKMKKGKQTAAASESEHPKKPEEETRVLEEKEQGAENKMNEEALLTSDQIRPKVIFNLSSKTKVLLKPDEWHRPSVSVSEAREAPQPITTRITQRERRPSKNDTCSVHKRNNETVRTRPKEHTISRVNWIRCSDIAKTPVPETPYDASCDQDHNKDLEKPDSPSPAVTTGNDIGAQKSQKLKKENRKSEPPTSESSWKNRVISRFLKMSKNDICNMVNNSSLRKFDIAMKHLVKERRSSLSLKMRNTEDEKMKEYDREEFMNQLNAMLDPSAVVGITDLPTEFIHHLSEVLQLDPMPTDVETSDQRKTNADEVETASQDDDPRIRSSEYFDEESTEVPPFDYQEHDDPCSLEQAEDKSSYAKDDGFHCSPSTELAANLSREDTGSSKRSFLNKTNPEAEVPCKRQQPLFNEADLDDILSQVTERTRSLPDVASRTHAEARKAPFRSATEIFERDTFAQISNATAADLDDIFSAGIARAKSLSKSSELDTSRARKSSSEDRSTFRNERCERWSRKERDDPDSFRNLTKEEWDAKYGTLNACSASGGAWKATFNSAENLSRDSKSYQSRRHCSSDSPMRNFSVSPLAHELPAACNRESCADRCSEPEEPRTLERSESNSDRSTSSSSETDGETVAPDVTKLLKVIKEKEKIAKKRTLNETIRDEVTAEIEKKWKERNRCRERKSRKRERRKKDKRERRKRDRKRRRKRDSHSNTSGSSEFSEEFRLMTEDEIKKEVTVKEEPLSTFEDSVSQGFNNERNNGHAESVDKTVEASSWIECSQPEKQQVPIVTTGRDKATLQPRKKPTIVSTTVQPKTKAQLKQMPDSDESELNQMVEKPVETENTISAGSAAIADSEKTNEDTKESGEVTETEKERTGTCANDALPRTNALLQIVETAHAEAVGSNVVAANVSGSCAHPVIEAITANQPSEQKGSSTSKNEIRSGYKKIDIKVYKERALQRRLQEEAKLRDKCASPVSQDSPQPALPTNRVDSETETEKEAKSAGAANDAPPKDPRLAKTQSSPSRVPSRKEAKEQVRFEEEHQCTDIFQKNNELSAYARSKTESPKPGTKVKSIARSDTEFNILKDPLPPTHRENDDKASAQENAKRESEVAVRTKVGSKVEADEMKPTTKLTTTERNRFKNIRSEGSKELKLKKEKKSAKSRPLAREKDSRHPQRTEQLQKSTTVNGNDVVQAEAEKIINSDTAESATSVESFAQESSGMLEVGQDRIGADFAMEDGRDNLADNNKNTIDAANPANKVNKEFMLQELRVERVDQEDKEVENGRCSLISEIEGNGDRDSEVNATQCESVEEPRKEEAVIAENVSTAERHKKSHPSDESVSLNDEDDLKNDDNNFTSQEDNSNENVEADVASSESSKTEIEDSDQEKRTATVQKDERTSKDCNNSEPAEIRSPGSSGSPFKGFFAEAIEDDILRESASCNVEINNGIKKSVTEDCAERTEVGVKDQPSVKEESPDDRPETEEANSSAGATLARSSIEEEQRGTVEADVVGETVPDRFNVVDTGRDGAKILKPEDELKETDVERTRHGNFSPIHDLVSGGTFDEDGEPFIVLDEYIDDTAEGRSLEKLNHLDIDLEECIARDTDTFVGASKEGAQNPNLTQTFDAIDFKELSEDLDKSNATTTTTVDASEKIEINASTNSSESNGKVSAVADISSSVLSESNTVEPNMESSEKSKSAVAMDAEDPASRGAPDADDVPRESPFRELSFARMEGKTERNSGSSTSSKEVCVSARSTTSAPSSGGNVEQPSESSVDSNGSDADNKKHNGGKIVSIASDAAEMSVNRDVQFNAVGRDACKANEALRSVRDKPRMKCKQSRRLNVTKSRIKEAVAADTVKPVYPSTKEAIMARMIEIDVEIHKLMTEKMTLYQMLTSDALPTDNDLEQNDTLREHKDTETSLIRPRTPSALMSQLIQNIETKPVANQCAKTTVESVLSKDSPVGSVQLGKSKSSRCEQHSEKNAAGNVSTCSSENEEATHRVGDTESPSSERKRAQKGSERAVKWDNSKPECIKDTPHVDAEDKQTNNAIKPILKRACSRHGTIEEAGAGETSEVKAKEDCGGGSAAVTNSEASSRDDQSCTPDVEDGEKGVQTESRDSADEAGKTKASEQTGKKLLVNDADALRSMAKLLENRTPERSSIYSDDSTWDSLLQVPSDDQTKPTTGLALLEETYRKEIANTRRVKAETRKTKKHKDARGLLEAPLTPEEEELPLSALYVKKLHTLKRLESVEGLEEGSNNRQVWKNVVEVINAVAENKLEDLCTESPVERLVKTSRINVPDAEPKLFAEEPKEIVVSVPLTSIEDTRTRRSATFSDDNDYVCNYAQLTQSINKILRNSEEQANQNFIGTETQEITTLETPASIEKDAEPAENLEISQVTSSPAARSAESAADDVHGRRAILNIPEANVNAENAEETSAGEKGDEEPVGIDRTTKGTIATPTDESDRNDRDAVQACDDILSTRTVACDPSKNREPEHANEESSEDSSANREAPREKECAALDDPEGPSDPKDDRLASLKDHEAPKRRRESERSSKSSSEENNNRDRTPIPTSVDTAEAFKTDEASTRKPTRKRRSSRTPLRRSSRYTEETTKRIKLEIDGAQQSTELESLGKNVRMQYPSVSPTSSSYDDDTESVSSSGKRSRSQKSNVNRKRGTQSEIEISSSSSPTNEDVKDSKRCKHTMPEMMNCKVRLVDSKHTILKPNVDRHVLRKYGISTINLFAQSAPESTTKDTRRTTATLRTEIPQGPKLVRRTDDVTRSVHPSVSLDKSIRGPKPAKANSLANDKEITATKLADDRNPGGAQVPPKAQDPANEQLVLDVSRENRDKPDIEIVDEMIVTKNQHQDDSGSMLTVIDTKDDKEIPRTQYTVHKGPILDVKVFENSFLAASEDGRIYRYSQASNGILNIYKGHKAAVTCLYVYNPNSTDVNKEWMFSGSLDGTLRCYNITTGVQLRDTADIGSPVQCMDEAWGIIFIGTKSGHVSRYHIKSGVIKGNSIQFSDKSVLALKATNEGPRRVLIVASRSQPITIRDAQNGLFLRTICGQRNHTVYSLMRDHSLIYCGTSTTSILVFDFTNGEQITQYDAGVGIVCMRLYKQLLFAGCYDGNIYIFDTKDHRLVCSIPGPGNMLLSMEVIDNKIIAGSKDKRLQSWQMSRQVRALL